MEETDLEKFLTLYRSLGIEPRIFNGEEITWEVSAETKTALRLEEGHHPKLNGYAMFFTTIEFDADGKFLKQGFWE